MLDIWLDICRRAGINEILLNLHAHAEAVRPVLSQYHGMKIRVVEEPTLLGSAGTIGANREWIAGDDFWVFYADVLTTANLGRMLAFHRQTHSTATIGVYQVGEPSRCGIAVFDDNFVVREFVEKPTEPRSDWAFSGIMVATPELLRDIPQRTPADLGFDVLPRLINRMSAYPISEFIMDIGTVQNYSLAQDRWPGLGWIGVDFDGTLAVSISKQWNGPLGPPIPPMVERVKTWLAQGTEVRIFTARVCPRNKDGTLQSESEMDELKSRMGDWCEKHLGKRFAVTCEKDHNMAQLWDDKAVHVVRDTGEACAFS
jgi:mannose-1-phosphate guanylyltransferase